MRTRAKALTVSVAMVTAFAILPTFGAAAAEPLEDGTYAVEVGDATYTVEVVDGIPAVTADEGVEFSFSFDEETGRVLDEFEVAVGDEAYEVEVAEDGTVSVTAEPAEEEVAEDEGELLEQEELEVEETEETETEEVEETEEDEDGDEADEDDGAHGELVSTVAQCAPGGKAAREAGLPNHGFFVRAAAQGLTVDFKVDGEAFDADLSTMEGAEAFCTLAEELLAAADEEAEESAADAEAADAEGDETDEDAEERGRGNGRDKAGERGRDNAPGQLKKQQDD